MKQKLLILHGALGSAQQMMPLGNILSPDFEVQMMDFPGHGKRVMPEKFSCKMLAEEVLTWQMLVGNEPLNILGYSMGGYIAMYIAKHYPDRVNKIFTTATKYNWSKESAEKEIRLLNVEKMKEKVPAFCDELAKRHFPFSSWEKLVEKTREMMVDFSNNPPLKEEDFMAIGHHVLIAVGDRDTTAGLIDSNSVYSKLKNGNLLVLPGTPHPFEKIDLPLLAGFATRFFLPTH